MRCVAPFPRWNALAGATLIVGLLSTPGIAAEPERLSLTEQAPPAAITQGAKVVIAFNIMVPGANATMKDNVAQFVQGSHELLPALEQALEGMKPGEQKRVDLTPEQAFGPYDEAKKTTMPRDTLPRDVRPGTILTSREGRPFTVVEVNDAQAVVDYNHPLAGQRLMFDVKVLKVEKQG